MVSTGTLSVLLVKDSEIVSDKRLKQFLQAQSPAQAEALIQSLSSAIADKLRELYAS